MSDILVVGFDASPEASRAARWALAAARALGGVEVELVRAVSLPPIPAAGWEIPVGELLERHEREARAELEAEAASFRAGGVPARVALRRWLPVETLVEHAAARGASLLVVGQRGERPGRLLLGSTSGGVVRHAAVPVAVVRGSRAEVSPPGKILCGVDGSPPSLRALAAAARWFPEAEIAAVHVRSQTAELAPERLADLVASSCREPVRIEVRVLDGDAAAVLLDLAEAGPADLVAIGRAGLGPLAGRLLGSVADKLLRACAAPVLVVP